MLRQGHLTFVDELTRFAAEAGDERLTAIAERVAAPLRVAVRGRRGAGCSMVARALNRAATASGISAVVASQADAADPDADVVDVVVHVTVEVVKPEDRQAVQALAAARRPVLAVLNKADLAGFSGDGPIALTRARCAQFSALLGVPVEPMIGLLAVAALDDPLDAATWAALRALAHSAPFEGSVDGFLAMDNPDSRVPTEVRRRLLDTLDLFGVALAVAALRQDKTAAQVRALLRRASGVDAVLDQVAAVGAEVRYRRVLDAVTELEALAVSHDEISEFLSRDETVIARMAAAVDLAESAGLELGPCHNPAAHLSRALRWHRYSHESLSRLGPVSDLRRACGTDIARGSLRLWAQAGGESR
jgi:hypothetical protein